MPSITSVCGNISRPYPAPADLPAAGREAVRRKWRVVIAGRRTTSGEFIGGALRNGDNIHSVEHIMPASGHAGEFVAGDPDLLIIHEELLEQPVDSHVPQLLQRRPGMRVLVFGAAMNDVLLLRLAGAGVHGYINGRPDAEEIRLAVQSIMAGNNWIEHRIMSACLSNHGSADRLLTARLRDNIEHMCSELTRREKEILCQVIRGYAIKQIAAEVHLSHQGVKMHLARLFRKFSASNRNQLILAVLDRISPVDDLSLSLCSELRKILAESPA